MGCTPQICPNMQPRMLSIMYRDVYKQYYRGDHMSQLLSVCLDPHFLDKTDRMSITCANKLISN